MTVKEFKANKKVVIGFTGRIDSVVAAYLLKKQGYEVMAVSVIFYPREDEDIAPLLDEDGEEITADDFFCVNKLDDLTLIKSIAEKMGIGFFAVDASAEYKDCVGDKIIAARVAGLSYSPEYDTHALLIDILSNKAELLESSFVATGHFAKLSLPQNNKPIRVLSSNDPENDQCDFLAKVKKRSFVKMKLPLADMRKIEVRKVAGTLGFEVLKEKEAWSDVVNSLSFNLFIRKRLPQSMIKAGQVIDYTNDIFLYDHFGIHQFYIGQKKIKNITSANNTGNLTLDPELIVADIHYSSGTVVVIKPEKLNCEKVIVKSIIYENDEDISKPCYVYLKRSNHKERYRGLITIKNNQFADFTFDTPQKIVLFRGETVTFLTHNTEGARIYGIGEVSSAGCLIDGKIKKFPIRDEDIVEGEEVEKKVSDFLY
jgi:tRNA-specific 2-thiouridylase